MSVTARSSEVTDVKHSLVLSLATAVLCVAATPLSSPASQVAIPRPAAAAARGPAAAIDVDAAARSGVPAAALRTALRAIQCAIASGAVADPPTLTLIDYSRPSLEPRLWVFDFRTGRLLFAEIVAHGQKTGANMATRFSDEMNSHQSSLGLFVTADTYVGSNGYSLRLDGLEPGFNGRARERAIVMHGAPYVNAATAKAQGRLGRSWGCPALREAVARQVIDTIRGGGVVFSYYPDATWLAGSRFLNCGAAGAVAAD
jgi:hypothetical protein